MKSVLALAFVAVASGEDLALGYGQGAGDLEQPINDDKRAFYTYGPINVQQWMLVDDPQYDDYLKIKLEVSSFRCGPCALGTATVNYAWGTAPTDWDLAQQAMTSSGGLWDNLRLATNSIAMVPATAGQVWFRINTTCSTCSSTMELNRLEISVVAKSLAGDDMMHGGYHYQEDRNADAFKTELGKWGPVVRYTEEDGQMPISSGDFVVIQYDFDSIQKSGVVHYLAPNSTSFDALSRTHDASTRNCAASSSGCASVDPMLPLPGFKRVPSLTYTSGDVGAERMQIDQAPVDSWFARSLCTKVSTTSSTLKVAVGKNRVPAAAPGVLPNAIVLAILGLFAFLR